MQLLHPDVSQVQPMTRGITELLRSDDKLTGLRLKNVEFGGSSVDNISFAGAQLKNVDLSQAQLISVKHSAGLKGATISYEQLTSLAPNFAQELGILIKH